MVGPWPLVGRNEELAILVDRLRASDSAGILITGAAGVGKTRLAREALTALGSAAHRWVAATAASQALPFGAIASLVSPSSFSSAQASRSGEPTGQAELVANVLSALRRLGGGDRPMLAVDDAHFLDDASAVVVQQAALSGAARVLVTARSGERAPQPIARLWRDGVIDRLVLQPLSRREVEVAATSALGGAVERDTLERLWQLSEGNSLFLHELVEDGLETGALRRSNAEWSLDRHAGPGQRLRDLIASRLDNVTAGEQEVLELLAAAEPVGLAILESLCPEGVVTGLERRGLVGVDVDTMSERGPSARLAHPLYGEVLRAAMPVSAGRAARRRLAQVLPSTGAPLDVLRRALWTLEGGGTLPPDEARRAAAAANDLLDHDTAARLARMALDAGAGEEAAIELGAALNHLNRHQEAEEVLAAAAAWPGLSHDVAVAIALERLRSLFYGLGLADTAIAMLTAAASGMPRAEASQLDAERAVVLVSVGRYRDGLEIATSVLDDPEADGFSQIRALSAASPVWYGSGRTATALAAGDKLFPQALSMAAERPQAPALVGANQLAALVYAGQLDAASRLLELGEAAMPGWVATRARSMVALGRGQIVLLRGKPRTAASYLERAAADLVGSDASVFRPWCLGLLAECRALLGDFVSARALVDEAVSTPSRSPGLFETEVRHSQLWVTALAGLRENGALEAVALADRCHHRGLIGTEVYLLHEAARLGQAPRVAERLTSLRDQVDGAWAPIFVDHAVALARRDAEGLLSCASRFESVGAVLLASEAAAESAAALASDRGPEAPAVKAAMALTARLEARCEGARTPALADSAWPWPLTTREREIARLVGGGLSNRQVADDLAVSVRTVESHLHHIYAKIGVTTRQELRGILSTPSQE